MSMSEVSMSEQDVLAVESDLLGTLSVPANETFTFADGLLGFPEAREFVLVPAEREGFFWLQSLDFGALAFLLVDPFPFVDEFFVDLAES